MKSERIWGIWVLTSDFRPVLIRDICDTSSGGTPSRKVSEYFEERPNGHPWLASRELDGGYVYHAEEHISDEGLANSSAKYFPIDTVLLAMYGATAGKIGRLAVPMTTSQAICGMIARKGICHQGFLYYLVMAESWKIVWKNALGGAQPNISQLSIKTHPVEIPSYLIQEKIHNQLSNIDALIESTEQTTEVLAKIIQNLFRSWFIDFDPVKAKLEGNLPYGMDEETAAFFPDSFEDSELGLIPAGWKVKSLLEVSNLYDNLRIPLSSMEREERKGNYPYHGATSVMDYVDDFIFDGVHLLIAEDGSVVNEDGYPLSRNTSKGTLLLFTLKRIHDNLRFNRATYEA